jgi:hypothetical protein
MLQADLHRVLGQRSQLAVVRQLIEDVAASATASTPVPAPVPALAAGLAGAPHRARASVPPPVVRTPDRAPVPLRGHPPPQLPEHVAAVDPAFASAPTPSSMPSSTPADLGPAMSAGGGVGGVAGPSAVAVVLAPAAVSPASLFDSSPSHGDDCGPGDSWTDDSLGAQSAGATAAENPRWHIRLRVHR